MKILIVEDNQELLSVLQEGLIDLGFEVETATTGKEALKLAIEKSYDCIVLDIMLPEIDGISVCKKLRSKGIKTPILMLTAKDSIEDRVKGLETGADDYLVKPFDFRELVARIKALTRRTNPTDEVIICGPIRLYPEKGEVYINDQEVTLRKREFEILKLLLSNKGKIFSRKEIAEYLWKGEGESKSNVIDVHIKYIRDKLRPYNADSIIETIRGMGYKAKCPERD